METNQDFVSELGYLSLAVRLKRISDQMMHGARQLYKQHALDIEPNWYLMFKLLQKRGSLSITEIGEELGFSHPSVINIVRKMRDKGFLTCTTDQHDSRRQLIKLSKKALDALPHFEAFWQAGERSIQGLFDEESDFLEQLDHLEQQYQQADFMTRTLKELTYEQ